MSSARRPIPGTIRKLDGSWLPQELASGRARDDESPPCTTRWGGLFAHADPMARTAANLDFKKRCAEAKVVRKDIDATTAEAASAYFAMRARHARFLHTAWFSSTVEIEVGKKIRFPDAHTGMQHWRHKASCASVDGAFPES